METLALVLIIIGIIAVVCFSIAFFVELAKTQEAKEEAAQVEEQPTEEQPAAEATEESNEFDLDAMLAKLEASAEENQEVPAEEEPQEVQEEMNLEEQPAEENAEEVAAEEVPAEEAAVEEQPAEEVAEEAVVEEQPAEEVTEEVAEEPAEEKEQAGSKVIVIKEKTTEVINNVPAQEPEQEVSQEVVDLTTRLESVRASEAKVDADLTKATREINKYERTERRMARNQKLLDKKAEDLTKLNLVLYSVTDIKNIDNDKKQKQEELVTHINELKTSIKDAQTYLDTNREKYENSQKMKEFFEGEKARLEADEKEILTLMGQANSDATDAE